MIIEICIGMISLAFIILVIYLVITLHKVIQILKATKHSMINASQLLKTTNDLALDFQEKSRALNIFFRPLARWNKKKSNSKYKKYEIITEAVNFAIESIALLNRLKKSH
jgi:hypothetical protein